MSEAEEWLAARPVAALAMHLDLPERLFGEQWQARLAQHVQLLPITLVESVPFTAELETVEVLIAGWGCPVLDEQALERMPRLRAVVYTAGSVKEFATDATFARGIQITSAAATNALPVAEYTLASILFSGKRVFAIADEYRRTRRYRPAATHEERWGNYGTVVGIVGASRIGRRVIDLLQPFDIEVLVYDPVVTDPIPGARRVELLELLAQSDIVSLHAPAVPATHHMIDRAAIAAMRDGATLINTARGSLVDQDALADALHEGRISAVIDVTDPDPLDRRSRLFTAPNLVLTPHIAGSQGNELRRLGDASLRELVRFLSGQPFAHAVAADSFAHSA